MSIKTDTPASVFAVTAGTADPHARPEIPDQCASRSSQSGHFRLTAPCAVRTTTLLKYRSGFRDDIGPEIGPSHRNARNWTVSEVSGRKN